MRRGAAAATAAFLLLVGCSGAPSGEPVAELDTEAGSDQAVTDKRAGEDPGAEESQPEVEAKPETAEPSGDGWTEDDVEYQLASIQEGGRVSVDDPLIDRFAEALDVAESKCTDERRMIGDMVVRASQLAEEQGVATSPLEMLEGIGGAVPDEAAPMDCAEVVAGLLTLMEGRQ